MDLFVIGAGFAGATIARLFADAGKQVVICDRRPHVAGNMYDEREHGVLVHRYGPHILHTNSEPAAAFLRRFGEWDDYTHRVLGDIDGELCPIPFNLTSIDRCFSPARAQAYRRALAEAFPGAPTVTIGTLRGSGEAALLELAEFIHEKVFLHYTRKQWGMEPEALGEEVMGRVPVRLSGDDRYFSDRYQWMPRDGYTAVFERMLDHPNIETLLSHDGLERCALRDGRMWLDGSPTRVPVAYTGCVDELLGYRYGPLPYRSLRFDFRTGDWPSQPVAVVNHPDAKPYTRVTEFGHFYPERRCERSVLLYEYPQAHAPGQTIPYYPVPLEENRRLYASYVRALGRAEGLHLLGRLGRYQYMNMDQVVLQSMSLADELLGRR